MIILSSMCLIFHRIHVFLILVAGIVKVQAGPALESAIELPTLTSVPTLTESASIPTISVSSESISEPTPGKGTVEDFASSEYHEKEGEKSFE